jgi:hypothetical protein
MPVDALKLGDKTEFQKMKLDGVFRKNYRREEMHKERKL